MEALVKAKKIHLNPWISFYDNNTNDASVRASSCTSLWALLQGSGALQNVP